MTTTNDGDTTPTKATSLRVVTAVDVEVPRPANFLRTPGGMVPVSAFTDEALREIGSHYGEALVARAKEQREDSDD